MHQVYFLRRSKDNKTKDVGADSAAQAHKHSPCGDGTGSRTVCAGHFSHTEKVKRIL